MPTQVAAVLSNPDPAKASPAAAPIDHAHLARYTFGNRALEIEVLELFSDQAPEYLGNLKAARTEKAWRDAAHTLKGSARAVGAFRVAEHAARAEALRPAADAPACLRVIESIEAALFEARVYVAGLTLSA